MTRAVYANQSQPQPRFRRHRARAAMLASVMALGCTLPVAGAVADSPPGANVALSIRGEAELLNKVTLTQVAALLHVTPTELAAQIEVLTGSGEVTGLLKGLLANPNTTLQNVINELRAKGVDPSVVEQLINSLLSPILANSAQLQSVITALLDDLGIDGQLGTVASQLGVPVSSLEHPGLEASSGEKAAATLNTTTERLGTTLTGAGATTAPLTLTTPVVTSPVRLSFGEGTTELIGLPAGQGGVSLTTINSTSSGQPGSGVGPSPTATVSNAFSIVSIKITKGGLIVETVKLPGAGWLAIKGQAKAAGAKHGSTKTITVAPVAANVAGGTRTFTLRPSRAIRTAKRIAVSLSTTYKPTGGSPNTKRSSMTFKRAVRKGKRTG